MAALEARYIREVVGAMTYREALAVFTDLWTRAVRNGDFPGPWEEDIASDIELARVLNGLPKGISSTGHTSTAGPESSQW